MRIIEKLIAEYKIDNTIDKQAFNINYLDVERLKCLTRQADEARAVTLAAVMTTRSCLLNFKQAKNEHRAVQNSADDSTAPQDHESMQLVAQMQRKLEDAETAYEDASKLQCFLILDAAEARRRATIEVASFLERHDGAKALANNRRAIDIVSTCEGKTRPIAHVLLYFEAMAWAIVQFFVAGSNFGKLDEQLSSRSLQSAFLQNPIADTLWIGFIGSVHLGIIPLYTIYFIIASFTDGLLDETTSLLNKVLVVVFVGYFFFGAIYTYWLLIHEVNNIPPGSIAGILTPLLISFGIFVLYFRTKSPRWLRNSYLQTASILAFVPIARLAVQTDSPIFWTLILVICLIPFLLEYIYRSENQQSLYKSKLNFDDSNFDVLTAKRKRLFMLLFISVWILVVLRIEPSEPRIISSNHLSSPSLPRYILRSNTDLWLKGNESSSPEKSKYYYYLQHDLYPAAFYN